MLLTGCLLLQFPNAAFNADESLLAVSKAGNAIGVYRRGADGLYTLALTLLGHTGSVRPAFRARFTRCC